MAHHAELAEFSNKTDQTCHIIFMSSNITQYFITYLACTIDWDCPEHLPKCDEVVGICKLPGLSFYKIYKEGWIEILKFWNGIQYLIRGGW